MARLRPAQLLRKRRLYHLCYHATKDHRRRSSFRIHDLRYGGGHRRQSDAHPALQQKNRGYSSVTETRLVVRGHPGSTERRDQSVLYDPRRRRKHPRRLHQLFQLGRELATHLLTRSLYLQRKTPPSSTGRLLDRRRIRRIVYALNVQNSYKYCLKLLFIKLFHERIMQLIPLRG